VNSICFDQADAAFTPGVLAFTRVITADKIGAQIGSGPAATEIGQILDADIYFASSDSQITFATPAALAANARAYDLLLTHELGHFVGFSHSAVWSAMMYPYAPAPGTFSGARPSPQQPDAPLGEDDRTGLRVLYPSASDSAHAGSISGRIVPANPLSLPGAPPCVTGNFASHVVAIDAASGQVIAGTVGGWSCTDPGPTQFDGHYVIDRLPVGRSYTVYAEPLDGVVSPGQISSALRPCVETRPPMRVGRLCRDALFQPRTRALQRERALGRETAILQRARFLRRASPGLGRREKSVSREQRSSAERCAAPPHKWLSRDYRSCAQSAEMHPGARQ